MMNLVKMSQRLYKQLTEEIRKETLEEVTTQLAAYLEELGLGESRHKAEEFSKKLGKKKVSVKREEDVPEGSTCAYVPKSGKNKDKVCGADAVAKRDGELRCARHKNYGRQKKLSTTSNDSTSVASSLVSTIQKNKDL